MLFETEKEANTFIKFNGNEIEEETGYKPERSYYCIACNGWHTSSIKEIRNVKSRTEIILEEYKKDKEDGKKFKSQPEDKKGENNLKKETILKATKEKREELNEIIKTIENNIQNIKTIMVYRIQDSCIEIIDDSYKKIELFNGVISELETIYVDIISKEEIANILLNKQIIIQDIKDTLICLKQN